MKALVGLFGPDDACGMSGPGTTVKSSALQRSVRNTQQLAAPIVQCDRAVKKGHKLAGIASRTHPRIGPKSEQRTPRRQIGWKSPILPVFGLIVTGWLGYTSRSLADGLVHFAYNVAMPALLFITVAQEPARNLLEWRLRMWRSEAGRPYASRWYSWRFGSRGDAISPAARSKE